MSANHKPTSAPQKSPIQQAVAIIMAHLNPLDQVNLLERADGKALFEIIVHGDQTRLEFTIEISTSSQQAAALVTTRFFLFDIRHPKKSNRLSVGDTLVAEKVTQDNPGPALASARAMIKVIKDGANLATVRAAGNKAYKDAKLADKFGTANRIPLAIPVHRRGQAKTSHRGRLKWSKTDRTWSTSATPSPRISNSFLSPARSSPEITSTHPTQ